MYVHSLDGGWMNHPFIRSHFVLSSEADLMRLRASNPEGVSIDTARGLDTLPEPGTPVQERTSHREELASALRIKHEAESIIHTLLTDVRMGRQIQVEHLQPVVTRITDSILRSPGTLVSLCRPRQADRATFQHSVSSCALLIMFGHHLDLDRATQREAGLGGMLHDIGKMRVADHILNKPGKLTEAEIRDHEDHVRLGMETLSHSRDLEAGHPGGGGAPRTPRGLGLPGRAPRAPRSRPWAGWPRSSTCTTP